MNLSLVDDVENMGRINTTSTHSLSSTRSTSSSTTTISRQQYRRCLVVSIVLVVAIIILARYENLLQDGKLLHKRGAIKISKFDDDLERTTPTYPLHPNIVRLDHRNHYYLFPSKTNTTSQQEINDENGQEEEDETTRTKFEGVLLYLHSCHQTGLEFFHLPEQRIIAAKALERGLVVFAPTSRDRRSGCFTSEDVETLPRLIDDWLTSQYLQYLPRMAIADSSSGSFLSFVWKELDVRSVALYNTPVTYEWDLSLPTAIVTMQRDEVITTKAYEYTTMLQGMNISTKLFKINPRPFTQSLCAARFPELTVSSSSSSSIKTDLCDQVFRMLHKDYSRLLDSYGFIKDSTRSIRGSDQWSSLLDGIDASFQQSYAGTKDGVQSVSSPYDTAKTGNGKPWFSTVLEHELRTCQGFHSMTAEWHSDVLQFLMANKDISQTGTRGTGLNSTSDADSVQQVGAP
mmetsp:Transcript_34598/g.83591  ORF Transcript_34598/g.83591 Transcript_34598/m.83591 type:complete len:459 (-) Transcript_34598:1156-2532(-)